MISLDTLGWGPDLHDAFFHLGQGMIPARVAVEHRSRYELLTEQGPCWAQLSGALRHATHSSAELPAVGDWVALRPARPGQPEGGVIRHVLPRRSCFVRSAAGDTSECQVLAANIDTVFVVTSLNREFNPRRLERYIASVAASGAAAVLVLNKADLVEDAAAWACRLGPVAQGTPVLVVSATEQQGLERLRAHLAPGRTVALVGSSGVGKSTLVNRLVGAELVATSPIREDDDEGRHTTTRRELILLPEDAGVVVDTPGMRELQLWGEEGAVAEVFGDVEALAQRCRFRNCGHDTEPGCAVVGAVETGELSPGRLRNYLELEREEAHQLRRQSVRAQRQYSRDWARRVRSGHKQRKELFGKR